MTERLPMPEDATQPPVKKPTRIPWTALILIVVIGAVIAVGISSHGDYENRAQVVKAVMLLSSTKAPLADYYEAHKKWPQSLADMPPGASANYVQSVAITKGAGGAGEIELTATMETEGVDRRIAGKSVRLLSADGGKNWVCRTGTVPEKIAPAGCRASQ